MCEQSVTLDRASRVCTIRRSTTNELRWWCYGPATRDGNTLRWPSGASLRVIKGELTSYDPAVLVEPWEGRVRNLQITDVEIEEPVRCEDRDLSHIVNGAHHDNVR